MRLADPYHRLISECRSAFETHTALSDFAAFPQDIKRQVCVPRHRSAATAFLTDDSLVSQAHAACVDAIRTAAPTMHWRETYKGKDAATAFMDRLGCFSVIGQEAPYTSEMLRLFVVYMPPELHYPWHSHPAEEAYLVIAGEARFEGSDGKSGVFGEGDVVQHETNEPHAITTGAAPMLSLVVWRSHLATPPVLVDPPSGAGAIAAE